MRTLSTALLAAAGYLDRPTDLTNESRIAEPLIAIAKTFLSIDAGGTARHQAIARAVAEHWPSGTDIPADVRIASRVAARCNQADFIAEASTMAPATLVVAQDARWFERDGNRVELGRRPVLGRMLGVLATARVEAPGRIVMPKDLVAATWPDERMVSTAATMRLHATTARLRREGLAGILEAVQGGYRLSPDVSVRLSDTSDVY